MFKTAFFSFLLILFSVLPVFSEQKEIVVVVDDYPPWKIIDQDKSVNGIDIELLNALMAPYDLKIKFAVCPWKRCLEMMKWGEGDIITGILRRPDREAYMHFIDPPYKTTSAKAFYLQKGKGTLLKKYGDLYSLRVGTVRGVKFFEQFDNDPKINKFEANNDIQNLKKLKSGRIDVVVGTESYLDYLIAIKGFMKEIDKAAYKYDRHVPVHFAVSKKSPLAEHLPRLGVDARRLAEQGRFEQIIKDFFEKLTPE